MANILIADDNIDYAINLMNYINEDNDIIRVCNITKDGRETINILNNENNIDIILLDYKMPIYNAQEILQSISNKQKYIKSCIIISGDYGSIKLQNNELVYSIIFKSVMMKDIKTKILQLVEYKDEIKKDANLTNKIINEMLYLGYDISHKGTKYLIDTIKYVYSNPNSLDNLEKYVYHNVARKYEETVYNIKCRINKANTFMYCNCKIERLKEYFKFDIDTKPKIKTVITMIINHINKM